MLYLHLINTNRIEDSALRSLLMFKNLCGKQTFARIALVTTFWSHVDDRVGHNREKELETDDRFWETMIQNGSKDETAHNTITYQDNEDTKTIEPSPPSAIRVTTALLGPVPILFL
jgi:hypothetical protein